VQLVYQDWRTEWFPAMVQQMLDQFHDTHPNIRVFYSPDPENVETKLLSDMQAGTAPDVFQGCSWWFPILAQRGHTLDLRPFVEADLSKDTVEDWDAAQYRAFFTADGRQYALPKYYGALALYYNKDLFDRYRVDYPDSSWSRNEYLGAMRQLTHDRDRDGSTDLWGSMIDVSWERIQIHVNGSGGNLVDPTDPRRCRMADPEAMDALRWLHDRMQVDKVMATSLNVQRVGTAKAFASAQVAMVEDGSWALKDILSEADFRVGIAPFPAGPIRRVTLASSDGFGIYAGTRHPEAAWELMKFLVSKDYGRAMARANFLQPARVSLVDEWADSIRQEFPEKARDANVSAFADGHVKGYSVTGETAANMAEATRIAQDAWDRILTLGQWPVESMKGVAREIELAQRE
jgi:multiple sugar transport system substrate-binding protein